MSSPNREISMHSCFFSSQAKKVKNIMSVLLQKDSPNAEDIQAMKILLEVYESLSNPIEESQKLYREVCSSNYPAISQ